MTLLDSATIPSTTDAELTNSALIDRVRADRLSVAGAAWGERIAADSTSANLTFTVRGVAEGSVATRITSGKHTFLVDEPDALAGDDAAASPVEYALGALISCQVVVYRLYAHALGIQLDTVEIVAEGDLDVRGLFGIDDTVRSGFGDIRLAVTVTGSETQSRYEELRRAVDAHCPVGDLFANLTPLRSTIVKA